MATTELIDLAVEVSQQAYVPYSHFPIGAVLLTKDGEIYTGAVSYTHLDVYKRQHQKSLWLGKPVDLI